MDTTTEEQHKWEVKFSPIGLFLRPKLHNHSQHIFNHDGIDGSKIHGRLWCLLNVSKKKIIGRINSTKQRCSNRKVYNGTIKFKSLIHEIKL